MSNNSNNFIIFHKNCIDGFSGLTVAYMAKLFTHKEQIFAEVPSATAPPLLATDKNVIAIDVAYSYETLMKLCSIAKRVLFIDHHLGTEEILKKELPTNLKVIYNPNYSGALNAWKYFFPKNAVPIALKYVNDNDIGKWEIKNTLSFITGCEVLMSLIPSMDNIKKWKFMLKSTALVNKIIKRGKIYEEYKNSLIQENKERATVVEFPGKAVKDVVKGKYKAAVLNGACPGTTSVANAVLDNIDCDFVIVWSHSVKLNAYFVSFRSRSVDVNEIAKALGGGGHKLAAACKIPADSMNIAELFGAPIQQNMDMARLR